MLTLVLSALAPGWSVYDPSTLAFVFLSVFLVVCYSLAPLLRSLFPSIFRSDRDD